MNKITLPVAIKSLPRAGWPGVAKAFCAGLGAVFLLVGCAANTTVTPNRNLNLTVLQPRNSGPYFGGGLLELLIREAVISGIEASEGAARTERFDRLMKASEGGDINAQNELAAMYQTCFGSGVC